MHAVVPFLRFRAALVRGLVLLWSCCGMWLHAQLSVAEIPDDPPDGHLYQASEGNLYFEKFQADQLRGELQGFARRHGFAVYLVTVNSPEKSVFIRLRQEIKRKWAARRDCMVIFYDLDTRLLALQFEPVYQDDEERIVRSKFSYDQEEAWVEFIDRWMIDHDQEGGLELAQVPAWLNDFLGLLDGQLSTQRPSGAGHWWVMGGCVVLALSGFVVFLRLRRRVANPVVYVFPRFQVPYRLKAPHGGGLIAVHRFGPGGERR